MTIVSSYVSLPEGIYTSYPQKSPRLTVARHRGDGTSEAVAGDDHVLTSWHHVVFKKTAAATWFISSNCGEISSLTVKHISTVNCFVLLYDILTVEIISSNCGDKYHDMKLLIIYIYNI